MLTIVYFLSQSCGFGWLGSRVLHALDQQLLSILVNDLLIVYQLQEDFNLNISKP